MAVPTKSTVLAEFEPLTHAQRMSRVSRLGRDNAGTPELRELLDDLDANLYEWHLRLTAAKAAHEPADIVDGLRHPLRSVRTSAIHGLKYVHVDDSVLATLLSEAAPVDRRELIKVLRRRNRTALADQLLPQIYRDHGASDAAALLPACSTERVTEFLPLLDHAVASWPSLARRHPLVFLSFVRHQMDSSPITRDAWWQRAGAGISALVGTHPDEILDLWEHHSNHTTVPGAVVRKLKVLTGSRPERTIELLLKIADHRRQLPIHVQTIRRALRSVTPEVQATVAAAVSENEQTLALVLEQLAPSQRNTIFDHALAGKNRESLMLTDRLLQALPYETRVAEVRRMLRHSSVVNDPERRLNLIAFLPLTETWDELKAGTRASDARIRSAGYRRLITAVVASRDPVFIDRLFDELQRLENEQDPVRQMAFGALVECSPALLNESHMSRITNLVMFAALARDTSYGTRGLLQRLLRKVIASAATLERRNLIGPCVDALSILAGQAPLSLGAMHNELPSGGEEVLFTALAPQIRSDLAKGRPAMLFTVARALGRRGDKLAELQNMLGQVTRSTNQHQAQTAIGLWLGSRGGKAERLGRLVDHDASAALLPIVFPLLSLVRQDLLDVAFSREARTGRFMTSPNHQVIPLARQGFHRWNRSQRVQYASLLQNAILKENTAQLRSAATRCLTRLPEVELNQLGDLLQRKEVTLVEAVLGGLSWGERPAEALDTLLSYASGDRARVAIFSASRAAQYAEPDHVTEALRTLLRDSETKLTSRKEAMRILGRNPSPQALAVLAEVWESRPLHRDLNIALASALQSFPNEELTWDVLEAMAAGSADEALALSQASHPLRWPAHHRKRVAALQVPLVNHTSHHVRQAAWHDVLQWQPWSAEVSQQITSTVSDLDKRADLNAAVVQLRSLVHAYLEGPVFSDTISQLLAQEPPAGSDASHERDLPIVQRLRLLAEMRPVTQPGRDDVRLGAEYVVDRGYAAESLQLFLWSGKPNGIPTETFTRLAEVAEQHPSALPALVPAVAAWFNVPEKAVHLKEDGWAATARELHDRGSDAGALLALAIVQVVGPHKGWPAELRELLSVLRSHQSPWVSHGARNVLVVSE